MEYFVYCRDNPDSAALRRATTETHWSFMDAYANAMIARGPTLADDWTTPTGSMHIIDLPDAAAVRHFAYEEPFYKAGVFASVQIHRWRNGLGRTMWDFAGDPTNNRRFLIIGQGKPGMTAQREALLPAHRRFLDGHAAHFIARGPLLADDGETWVGSAMLVEAPSRAVVEAMFADEPYTRAGLYQQFEIINWRFGGRH